MSNTKNVKDLASIAGSNTATSENVAEQSLTVPIPQAAEGAPRQFATAPAVDPKLEAMRAEILAMELETKRIELEDKKLELKLKAANLEDTQERLNERELKREQIRQKSRTNGQTLKQIATSEASVQKRCNHRKGGTGAEGLVAGKGNSPEYAILDHTFCNGDRWIRCLRCGKTWKPPVESQFATKEEYLDAYAEYKAALNFQTPNTPSGSVQFRFSDNGQYYREQTAQVTLR